MSTHHKSETEVIINYIAAPEKTDPDFPRAAKQYKSSN